jgi:hypothetical protein
MGGSGQYEFEEAGIRVEHGELDKQAGTHRCRPPSFHHIDVVVVNRGRRRRYRRAIYRVWITAA